jgi:HNH endonuclease
MSPKPVTDILGARVLYDDGCWEWNGWHNAKGYSCVSLGQTGGGQKHFFVHRVMYELLIGPIPEGKQIDHLCRNRGCVNPWHCEPVVCRENLMRGETHAARLAARTHCDKGHPFDEANTLYRKDGSRRCRECNKIACRKYDQEHPGRQHS